MDEKPDIHMPSPSYWPILLAFGMLLIAVGVVLNMIVTIVGVVWTLAAIAGWAMENRKPGEEQHYE